MRFASKFQFSMSVLHQHLSHHVSSSLLAIQALNLYLLWLILAYMQQYNVLNSPSPAVT